MKIAQTDHRLSVRKVAGAETYLVESAPLNSAEYVELFERVQGAILLGQRPDSDHLATAVRALIGSGPAYTEA